MAFPTTPVLDTFTQADGPLSANWTAPALGDSVSPYVETNSLRYPDEVQASACWNQFSAAAVEVYFQITQLNAAGDYEKIIFRASINDAGATTSYNVRVVQSSGNWELRKRIASVETSVATFTALQIVSVNDWVGVSCVGSTIELWYKAAAGSWTLKQTTTDSSITSAGYIGVGSATGITVEPRVDNFGGGIPRVLPSDTPRPMMGRGATW